MSDAYDDTPGRKDELVNNVSIPLAKNFRLNDLFKFLCEYVSSFMIGAFATFLKNKQNMQ